MSKGDGTKTLVAVKLGIPLSTLSNFLNGRSGMSFKRAQLMELRVPRAKAIMWMKRDIEGIKRAIGWPER